MRELTWKLILCIFYMDTREKQKIQSEMTAENRLDDDVQDTY